MFAASRIVQTNEDLSIKSGTGDFCGRQGANFNDARQVPRGVEPPPPPPLPDFMSATYAAHFCVSTGVLGGGIFL